MLVVDSRRCVDTSVVLNVVITWNGWKSRSRLGNTHTYYNIKRVQAMFNRTWMFLETFLHDVSWELAARSCCTIVRNLHTDLVDRKVRKRLPTIARLNNHNISSHVPGNLLPIKYVFSLIFATTDSICDCFPRHGENSACTIIITTRGCSDF